MFLLSSSVHVFFFWLMDNKRSCLLAALVNKDDNNTFLSYHYLGSAVTRRTPFNNSLLSFLERCFVAVMSVAVACVIDAMVVFVFAFFERDMVSCSECAPKFCMFKLLFIR
jgi:hypothetical protein